METKIFYVRPTHSLRIDKKSTSENDQFGAEPDFEQNLRPENMNKQKSKI